MAGPVVPIAPGVPPLVRDGPAPPSPPLLTGDTITTVGVTSTPQWGLFLNGAQVVFPDSVVTFEFKQDWDLLDYPVEDGGFETYNKVKTPAEIRMRIATGGGQNNRTALLDVVSQLAETEDLYDVTTPEVSYLDYNIENYSYRRSSDSGVGIIIIDVHLRQIRVVEQPQFSNTAAPSGADAVNEGAVQAGDATSTQQTAVWTTIEGSAAPTVFSEAPQSPVWSTIDSMPQPPPGNPNPDDIGTIPPSTYVTNDLFPPNGAGW
jgi:hypothetical protein